MSFPLAPFLEIQIFLLFILFASALVVFRGSLSAPIYRRLLLIFMLVGASLTGLMVASVVAARVLEADSNQGQEIVIIAVALFLIVLAPKIFRTAQRHFVLS